MMILACIIPVVMYGEPNVAALFGNMIDRTDTKIIGDFSKSAAELDGISGNYKRVVVDKRDCSITGSEFRLPAGRLIKIAIIDTGLQLSRTSLKLCNSGHFNFANGRSEVGVSTLYPLHGTKVASIIAKRLKNVDYCAIIYQVQRGVNIDPVDIAKAAHMARLMRVDAVNISLAAASSTLNGFSLVEEHELYDLSKKSKVFVAAGNYGINLDTECTQYPACYVNDTVIVGALEDTKLRAPYSNYGDNVVTEWRSGSVVWDGVTDQGTSYAAPQALSDYVLSLASGQASVLLIRQKKQLPQLSEPTITTINLTK